MRYIAKTMPNRKYPHIQIGQKFERLEVIEDAGRSKTGIKLWVCQCKCGTVRAFFENNLQTHVSRSCGCLNKELLGNYSRTHGMSKSNEYSIWADLKGKILDPDHRDYGSYGAKGIGMDEGWANSFQLFFNHLGFRPSLLHVVTRISKENGYFPGNVRWATRKEVSRDRRSNRFLTLKGETLTLAEWAERIGMTPEAISARIKRGYSEDELFLPSYVPREIATLNSDQVVG